MKSLTVGQIMTREPIALSPHTAVRRAREELDLARIRHLPVVDKDGGLLGVVSLRDILVAGDDPDLKLEQIMQADVMTVGPETQAHEAAYLLLRHAIGCVPVTDAAGRLVGIVTETDFVRIAYIHMGGQVPVDQLEAEEREAENV
ncbi:MAG TPA: CBS domain-containing protein [Kofleriaceae bacterium]|nr:CBS domain-containing protein [Kofleriaceae bacterium]